MPLYFLLMAVDSLFSIKPWDYFCIKSHILEFLHYLLLCVCVLLPFTVYGTVIEFSQIKTYICITFGIPSIKHVWFSKLFSPTSASFPSWPNGSGYVASHENCMAFFFAKTVWENAHTYILGKLLNLTVKPKYYFKRNTLVHCHPHATPRHTYLGDFLFSRLQITLKLQSTHLIIRQRHRHRYTISFTLFQT